MKRKDDSKAYAIMGCAMRVHDTPVCELRRLGFSLPLHCSALFNHGQVTPFIVYIAAFGRFMQRSRIPKHSRRHIYSRCEVRSCGALAGARTLGVDMLAENAFKEMPTLANRWSNFRFSSGIQVYFWMQRVICAGCRWSLAGTRRP